jgi:hypothetical protein
MRRDRIPSRTTVALVGLLFLLLAVASCSAPSSDPPATSRFEQLELKAADTLGLVPPVIVQGVDAMNCACLQGRLLDAGDNWAAFCVYSEGFHFMNSSSKWGVAPGKCLPPKSQDGASFLVNSERQQALYVILAAWLVREFSPDEIRSIQESNLQHELNSDFTERESKAALVLRLAKDAEDPTMNEIIDEGTT